jgi:hypothetical protein
MLAVQPGQAASGLEHDVLDDQLAAVAEQSGERDLPPEAFERVLLVDPDHRQPAALSVQAGIPGGLLLLQGQQPQPSLKPILAGNDLRQSHRNLLGRDSLQE